MSEKKKILIVTHHLTIGGVQKSLVSALKAINYEKYDVTLYLRKNRKDLLKLVDDRVNVVINDDKTHYYRKPKALVYQGKILLSKLLKKNEQVKFLEKQLADQIRTWMMEYEKDTYFKEKNYDVAISYVQGYTTIFVADYVNADKKIMFYQVSTDELHDVHENTMPKYDSIIVEHEDIKKLMEEWYPLEKNKIDIIENYVDSEIIKTQADEENINLNDNRFMICSCGRFAKVKGFDLAVEAAKYIKEQGIDFVWYLVGDGPERKAIEELVEEYKLQENIVFTGMKTNPYPYIKASDIYVQPSYEEALSIALLEAQVLAKPIVTTKTVGGLSMINDGIDGKLVDINKKSLAEGLIMLLKDESIREDYIEQLKKVDYDKLRTEYQKKWDAILS